MGLVRDRTGAAPHRRAGGAIDAADPTERREAVASLPDTPEFNTVLAQRLDSEPDGTVRQLILTTLAQRQRPEVVRALMPYLASDEPSLRAGAAEALARMPDAVAEEIPGLLIAESRDVRIMTVMMLGQLRHSRVTEWLSALASVDADPNVVGCALSELMRLEPTPYVGVFEKACDRFPDDPFIAFLASAVIEESRR